ncbi:TPA: hypothetical protein PSK81_000271 [Staphylococcus aureus]|uniref:hypothetical protein n=1 Tax=Staphylococcus aureus TaxID=1280 RepID=UPI0031B5DBEB|nr:hypothetical protein [Staphylococcus aureus]HDK4344979.1 hypothetical protein [Staphylococcus aureus]HDK4379827.1 hypothetical protein [Staphylococcus aureus]HDK4397643.1 hypothetical protein [Staphylococcus aureus]HDK4508911.1 hypothetical protein [Staphylococcus aureus]
MERNKFSMYWAYYKFIEDKLIATNQYVTHTKDNELCYSDEFISIILLSCSEIDSILKELLRNKSIPSKKKYYQMSDYASVLKDLTTESVETMSTSIDVYDNNRVRVTPFEKIDSSRKYGNLIWWEDYQSIKHDRIHNIQKGNLINAVTVLAAHFLIIRLLIQFIPKDRGREYLYKETWGNYWIPTI